MKTADFFDEIGNFLEKQHYLIYLKIFYL